MVWSPGSRIGIALVGKMDIDKDGRDDREYVKNMIVLNGGKIDAEDGGERIKGEVTFNTRYVVVGEGRVGWTEESLRPEDHRNCPKSIGGADVTR